MTSALFLSTDTLDKPLEGYAAHRKTPPSTDSLTQRSYLTHNKTAVIPNGTAAVTAVRCEAPNASFFSSALIPEDRGRRDPTGFPLNAFRSTKPPYPQLRRSRIRGLQVRGRIQRETHRVPVRATGLSITPCSAILPRRRSQSKGSGSCTRPSSPRPSRPGSYAPREGRGPGR